MLECTDLTYAIRFATLAALLLTATFIFSRRDFK